MTKGNDGTGNIPERDNWRTPQRLFDQLNQQYDFRFDCCADAINRKTTNFSWDFLNVKHDIEYLCWINPPFSKAYQMLEHFFKVCNKGVGIYRSDNMESKLWQDIILKHSDWILILKGRVNYEGHKGKGARFPSSLFGVGIPPPEGLNGTVLILSHKE